MILHYIIAFSCVILWFRYLWLRRKFYVLSWKLPGPVGLPLFGNVLQMVNPEDILDQMHEIRHKYKNNFRFWIGPKLFVYIYHPDDIQKVLTAPECLDKSSIYKYIKPFFGDGLLSLDKEPWTYQRKLINPSFGHKVLLTFFPIFNKQVNTLTEKIGTQMGQGPFCVQDLAIRCSFDISTQTTMDVNLNTQNLENHDVLGALTSCKVVVGQRVASPLLHVEALYRFTELYKVQESSKRKFKSFVESLIKSKLALKNNNNTKPLDSYAEPTCDDIKKEESIFIDRAINLAEHGKFTWSDVQDQSKIIVLAAVDTTAATITYIIQCLAMHPECQEKVIEEVRSIFPNEDSDVTYEDTRNMVYCDHVINETLRLFPAGPFHGRRVSKDFKLTDGTVLPEDTEILIDQLGLHRDPTFWGPTAHLFDPMRFSDGERQNIHPYAHIPFSKGPRNCIGWRYAPMLLKVFMAKIFRKYRFTTHQKLDDFKFKMEFTLATKIKPLVNVHKL